MLSFIGHNISKRSTNIGLIGLAARLLYGICNLDCIKRFNSIIGLTENHTSHHLKLIKEQINVIKLKLQEFEEHDEMYNMTYSVNELPT